MTNYAGIISLLLYHYLLNFHFITCIKAYLPFSKVKLSGRHSNSQSTTGQDVRQHMHTCNIRVARSHDDLRESLTSCINFSYQLTVYSIVNLNASNINNSLIMHHSVKFIQNPWLHSLMYIYYWSTSREASTPGQGCKSDIGRSDDVFCTETRDVIRATFAFCVRVTKGVFTDA